MSPLKFWFKGQRYVLCGFYNHSVVSRAIMAFGCVYALVPLDIDGEILLRVSRANQT